MKRALIIILVVILILALSGCASGIIDTASISEAKTNNMMFIMVSDEEYGKILVDKTTGVMYWIAKTSGAYGVMTLLVNVDGTPRLWEG